MNKVKVLIEGRVKKIGDDWLASPSTVLIKDHSLTILVDPGGARDEKALQESRKKILEIADYIIPGHGKMFKVEK